MKAADIMTTEVVSVYPETEVPEIAQLLLLHRVSGAPVVDRDRHVLGIISEGDLIRRAEGPRGRSWWLSLLADKTASFVHVHGTRAQDVMSREVISIGKDVDVAEIARILEMRGIKRVPVLENGRLVGIVSRADILRGLASAASASGAPGATADDQAVRQEILDLIKSKTAASTEAISVIVVNGLVYLWGIAESETDRDAVRIAAETIVGRARVRDHLDTLPAFFARMH